MKGATCGYGFRAEGPTDASGEPLFSFDLRPVLPEYHHDRGGDVGVPTHDRRPHGFQRPERGSLTRTTCAGALAILERPPVQVGPILGLAMSEPPERTGEHGHLPRDNDDGQGEEKVTFKGQGVVDACTQALSESLKIL
jgi:hypothetical protein